MSEIDELKRAWQSEDAADRQRPLVEADVMRIVTQRARARRDQVLRRLRRELALYTLVAIGAVGFLGVRHPRAWLPGAAAFLGMYCAVAILIWHKARALERIALDGTLSDSIRRMIAVLNGWMTAYLMWYLVAVAGGGTVLLALLARQGMGPLWWGSSIGWAVFLVWNWTAGRAYVRREFGHHRDALVQVLRDLEDA